MITISHATAWRQFVRTMNRVCDGHQPIVIMRKMRRSAVMFPLKDYESLIVAYCLFLSPANILRVLNATEQLDTGAGRPRKINFEV